MEINPILQNVLAPPVLFFLIGAISVLFKSDLEIPAPLPKLFSLYLLLAIGFKGGIEIQKSGFTDQVLPTLSAAILMSLVIPLIGFLILRFKFGPKKYLRKELLLPKLYHQTERLISYYKKSKKPNFIHAHYADAGYVGVKLSKFLNVPLIFTGHSLGREKKRKLLDTGLKNNQIEKLYSIRKRFEA